MTDDFAAKERSMRARIAAYSMHGKHPAAETTRAGRAAAAAKLRSVFEAGIPEDTPPETREHLIEARRRAHFLGLARLSMIAREQRKAAKELRDAVR